MSTKTAELCTDELYRATDSWSLDRKVAFRYLAGAAEDFSSPELTLYADSYRVPVPLPCYRSSTSTTPVILLNVQVAGYH